MAIIQWLEESLSHRKAMLSMLKPGDRARVFTPDGGGEKNSIPTNLLGTHANLLIKHIQQKYSPDNPPRLTLEAVAEDMKFIQALRQDLEKDAKWNEFINNQTQGVTKEERERIKRDLFVSYAFRVNAKCIESFPKEMKNEVGEYLKYVTAATFEKSTPEECFNHCIESVTKMGPNKLGTKIYAFAERAMIEAKANNPTKIADMLERDLIHTRQFEMIGSSHAANGVLNDIQVRILSKTLFDIAKKLMDEKKYDKIPVLYSAHPQIAQSLQSNSKAWNEMMFEAAKACIQNKDKSGLKAIIGCVASEQKLDFLNQLQGYVSNAQNFTHAHSKLDKFLNKSATDRQIIAKAVIQGCFNEHMQSIQKVATASKDQSMPSPPQTVTENKEQITLGRHRADAVTASNRSNVETEKKEQAIQGRARSNAESWKKEPAHVSSFNTVRKQKGRGVRIESSEDINKLMKEEDSSTFRKK